MTNLQLNNNNLMKYLTIFILTILFYSCESKAQSFVLADKIETTELDKKINIKGTRILIDKPENYTYIDELKRFQKNSDNYFQFVEIPNQDYNQTAPNVINKIAQLESQGGEIRVKKEFKLGDYNAFFALAPQGNVSEQVILAFGDNSFSVLVMGIFPNDEKERKEITDLILSSYFDKDLKPNLDDNLFHKVNLDNSDFKLSTVNGTLGTYTLNGQQIKDENLFINSFLIATLPYTNDFDLKKYSDNLIKKYENNTFEEKRIEIDIISEKEYKEEKNKIIKVDMIGTIQGKKSKMFQYIKQTPNGIIQFVGFDFTEDSSYLNEYKTIAEKITLK